MKKMRKFTGKIKIPDKLKNISVPQKLKNIKIPPKMKKLLIPIVVLVLILAALLVVKAVRGKNAAAIPVVNETQVVRTDITSSITGSATIQPKDMYSVTSLVTGDVIADTFSEGDIV